jgi:hypothetical protein
MQRQLVTSSNIVSIGHDVASAMLEIEFDKGSVYQYAGGPRGGASTAYGGTKPRHLLQRPHQEPFPDAADQLIECPRRSGAGRTNSAHRRSALPQGGFVDRQSAAQPQATRLHRHLRHHRVHRRVLGAVSPSLREDFERRDIHLNIEQVRTRDLWRKLDAKKVDMGCGSFAAQPGPDYDFLESTANASPCSPTSQRANSPTH